MIEEHLENTEKVRQNTERRCREEHAAIRHQSEEHAGQLAQLTAELERSQRKEMDLKKQLGDQKNISDRGMYCFDFGCGVFSRFVQRLWQYGLWSFQTGGTKLERFLPKNQHVQRKLLNFENWVNGEVSKIGHHFRK